MQPEDNDQYKVFVSQEEVALSRQREWLIPVIILLISTGLSLLAGYFLGLLGFLAVAFMTVAFAFFLISRRRVPLPAFIASVTGLLLLSSLFLVLGEAARPVKKTVFAGVPAAAPVYYWQTSTSEGVFIRSNFNVRRLIETKRPPNSGAAFLFDTTAASPALAQQLRNAYLVCSRGPIKFAYAVKFDWPTSAQRQYLASIGLDRASNKNIEKVISGPYPTTPWCGFAKDGKKILTVLLSSQPRYGSGGLDPGKVRQALGKTASVDMDSFDDQA